MKKGDQVVVRSTEYWNSACELIGDVNANKYLGMLGTLADPSLMDGDGELVNWSVYFTNGNDVFAEGSLEPYVTRWQTVKKDAVYVEHIVDEKSGTLREIEWVVVGKTATHVKLQTADGWIHQRPLMDIPLGTFQ